VRLNDFREVGPNGEIVTCADKLAEAVLAEVPDQLVGYMQSQEIKPEDKPADLKGTGSDDSDDDDKQNDEQVQQV